MNNWQVDLFTGLEQSTCMQDVLDVALKIVKPFGFDYAGWRSELPLPLTQRKTLALNTAEDSVTEKISRGYYDDAPVPAHCSKSMEPIYCLGTTTEDIFLKAPEKWEEYYSFGRYGLWAQSLIESKSMFSIFWVDTSAPVQKKDFESVNFEMQWVSTAVLSRMNKVRTKSNIKLSLREKEVLRWTGDGKTADQIAQILSLSHSTVNFHIRNAMMKLDTPNKTAAVVRAIFLGLLH